MAIGMSFAGSYGVPRRHWDVEFTGAPFTPNFDSGAHVMLGLLGVGAVIAFLGLFLFIALVVAAVFFGRSNAGHPMEAWHVDRRAAAAIQSALGADGEEQRTPGTLLLVLVFLASFAVYYFANWLWLADVWHVR
jgi:cytochrome c oxidase subunit 1